MIEMVEELKSTNSINEKIEIVEKYTIKNKNGKHSVIRDSLRYCYDPFFQTYLKKVKPTTVGNLSFYDLFYDFEQLILKLNKREFTGNLAIEKTQEVLNKANKETQGILLGILKKDLKCRIGASIINRACPDLVPEFDIQLANKWADYIKKKKFKQREVPFWWVSPKLDGIRGYYRNDLLSRKGKALFGFGHILDELSDFSKRFKLNFNDGELFSKEIPFQTIQSYVNETKNIDPSHKEQIFYQIFVTGKDWKNTTEMVSFMDDIRDIVHKEYNYLKIIDYFKISNEIKDIQKITEELSEQGFEGAMLRDPEIWYSWKRDDCLLKHKLFIEHDFIVVDYYEGEAESEFEGTLGGLVIEGVYGGKKVTSEVGSGFKVLEEFPDNRTELWKNKHKLIGKIVEVKFQGLTDKPDKLGFYSLRFPVYNKFKEDR